MASISIVVVHRAAVAYAVRPVDVCQDAAGQRNHVRLAGVQHGGSTDRVMQRAAGNNRQAAVFLGQRRKTESAALKGRTQCRMLGRMNVVRPARRRTLKVPSPRVGSAWLLSKVFTRTKALLSPFRLGTLALLNRVAVASITASALQPTVSRPIAWSIITILLRGAQMTNFHGSGPYNMPDEISSTTWEKSPMPVRTIVTLTTSATLEPPASSARRRLVKAC
jgi:hypothetical protein